jgi:hypothetical protein
MAEVCSMLQGRDANDEIEPAVRVHSTCSDRRRFGPKAEMADSWAAKKAMQ